MGREPASALRQTALKVLLSLVFTLVLIEAGGAAVIYGNLIPARLPSYEFPREQEPFFVDIDPNFGAWHPPHKTHGHKRACFSTSYRSNSYGALDVERPRKAPGPRVVVLGDSFATGHGVVEADRFSNRLEKLTGVPHMNFAAGGTAPTQYFLTYKHLAREFSHDSVLVGILPDNDFFEGPNDVRYQPYWDGTYPNYTLRYTLERVEQSKHHPSHTHTAPTAHDWLGNFSFFYNAADWVAGARKVMHRRAEAPNYAGYFDFTPEQFLRMRYSLEQLYAIVPEGRLTVIGMPRLIDLTRYQSEKKNPFGDQMSKAAQEVGFKFVDMLPLMAKAFAGHERDLYLGCDGHWGPVGHEFAAKTLVEAGVVASGQDSHPADQP